MMNTALEVDREMQDCSLYIVMLVTMHSYFMYSMAFDLVVITMGMQDFGVSEGVLHLINA